MRNLFLLISVFAALNLAGQTKISKVKPSKTNIKKIKQSINKEDINRLNLETKIVGGTAMPALYRFKNKQLILNGAGLRELLWIDVYACGLYLLNPTTDVNDIIFNDELMIVRMDILSKAVSHKKMVAAFKKGFEDGNSQSTVNELQKEIDSFLAHINGLELKVGDKVDVVYEPQLGVSLYINYKKVGTVGKLNFKRAIFNIWLSNDPVDKSLKVELLDGSSEFLKK